MTTTLDQARDLTLLRVGRNLVNFQRAEAALKTLLAASDVDAPLNELPAYAAAAIKRVSRMTVGQMRDPLLATLFSTTPSSNASLFLLSEARISMSVRLEGEDAFRELEADIDLVAKERNDLAHTMLLNFDADSLESCERLSAELNQQFVRTRPALERILGLAAAVRKAQKESIDELVNQLPRKT